MSRGALGRDALRPGGSSVGRSPLPSGGSVGYSLPVPFRLILAEKPSVARDIARALNVSGGGRGVIGRGDVRISWCLGHLVELAEPKAYDDEWRAWRPDVLPMLPDAFKLATRKDVNDQWQVVKDLLRDKDLEEVVNACDAGREGELIFSIVYRHAGCRAPV